MRPIRECRLCREVRPLCKSHLTPAGAFRPLRNRASKNPNPVYVSDAAAYTSAKQLQDYLLCTPCEQLLRKRGEDWVLANCYRDEQDFKIREALFRQGPAKVREDGVAVYRASSIPEIDAKQLIYFGMSVFWRAGAHSWKRAKDHIHISLGPYLESLRLFLLDQAPFPPKMVLAVRVRSTDALAASANYPISENREGYHVHQFSIPGLVFSLLVGRKVPDADLYYCTAPSLERFIGISPESDREDLHIAGSRAIRAVERGFRL